MWPVGHFAQHENQAQSYSQFPQKWWLLGNQISSRAYMDNKVSKYHKIYLGKNILWPWDLRTFEVNSKNMQISPLWGLSILLKSHFPREIQLQNDFLLSNLLTEYDW